MLIQEPRCEGKTGHGALLTLKTTEGESLLSLTGGSDQLSSIGMRHLQAAGQRQGCLPPVSGNIFSSAPSGGDREYLKTPCPTLFKNHIYWSDIG